MNDTEDAPTPEANEPTSPPVLRFTLERPPRLRPGALVAILAVGTLALTSLGAQHIARGEWDALVILFFGAIVVPISVLAFISKSPGTPVIELGADRIRLPLTTRAHQFVTLRYREITSLFLRNGVGKGGFVWLGTEQGTFLYPVQAFGGRDAAEAFVRAVRGRIDELLPDSPGRLARFDEQQRTADVAWSSQLWGTKALIVAFAVGFVLQQVGAEGASPFEVVRLGANAPVLVKAGDLYRVITSNLLHAGVFHLLVNGLLVTVVGSLVERLLGTGRFALVVLLAGILGPAATVISARASLVMGASSVVFGLLGAYAFTAYRYKDALPLGFAPPFRTWITVGLLLLMMSLLVPGADFPAHLGGFLAGVVVAALSLEGEPELPVRRPLGLVGRGALGVLGLAWLGAVGWGTQAYAVDDPQDRTAALEDYIERQEAPPGLLNQIAWFEAIDPGAPRARLALAKLAAHRAVSEHARWLREARGEEVGPAATRLAHTRDTLATVHHRLGEHAEAVRIEAEVLDEEDEPMIATQLARFLRGHLRAQGVLRDEGAPTDAARFTVRHHDNRGFGIDLEAPVEAPRTLWMLVERKGNLEGLLRLPLGPDVEAEKTLWLRQLGVEPVWHEGSAFRVAWVQPGKAPAKGWLMDEAVLAYPD